MKITGLEEMLPSYLCTKLSYTRFYFLSHLN